MSQTKNATFEFVVGKDENKNGKNCEMHEITIIKSISTRSER